jgi:hypothetical protein
MKRNLSLLVITLFITGVVIAQTTFTFTGKPVYQIDMKRGGNFLGTIKVELFPKYCSLACQEL